MSKMKFLSNKRIALGVCGASTAFEGAYLGKKLTEKGADLEVVFGDDGTKFISPLTFEEITGRRVIREEGEEETRELKNTIARNDMVIIAPASFNFIGRLASNLEGGLLSDLAVQADQPVVIVPSLDRRLYSSQNVKDNIEKLRNRGYYVIKPTHEETSDSSGTGLPLFPDPEAVINEIGRIFREDSLLEDKKVLVTAGPTRRSFNSDEEPSTRPRSSLGFQISEQARGMGGEVLLVSGPTEQIPPSGVGVVWTRTSEELDELLLEEIEKHDLIVMAGSAVDWETRTELGLAGDEKTMELDLDLDERPDVLRKLGKLKEEDQLLVSIDLEPQKPGFNPEEKMEEINLDAYLFREKKNEEERLNSGFYSGKLALRNGVNEEFHAQNGSRLARTLLQKVGKELLESDNS